jgi:hypothetical protein
MEVTEEQAEIERLKREKKELLTELEIAHVREEIMLAMPEVFEPAKKAAEKKTMRASEKKKQQEKRRKRKKRKQMRKRSRRR